MRGDRRQFLSTVSDRRAPTLGIPNPQHYLRPARPIHYPSHTPYTHSDARRELEHSLETPRTPDYPHLIRSKHLKTHQNGRRQETHRQEARRQEAHGEEARREEARREEAGREEARREEARREEARGEEARRQEAGRQEAGRQEAGGEEARRQEARGEEAGQEVDAPIALKTSRATTHDDRPLFPNPTFPGAQASKHIRVHPQYVIQISA